MKKIGLLILNLIAAIGVLLNAYIFATMIPYAFFPTASFYERCINIFIGISPLSIICVYIYSIYTSQKNFKKGNLKAAYFVAIGAILYSFVAQGLVWLLLYQS